MNIVIIENNLQELSSSTRGIFQLYFYKNLFDPAVQSMILQHKNLNIETVKTLLNEIFTSETQENERRIKLFVILINLNQFIMSLSIKNYREVSRSYLHKVIEKQKQGITSYPINIFDNNLANDLEKSGFFTEHKKVLWWRQEICPKLFVAYILQSTNMLINELCDRVHLINLLEEENDCNNCDYCKFINRLRNALNEKLFFTANAHIKTWDVRLKNDKLEVEPVGCSFCSSLDGIIQK